MAKYTTCCVCRLRVGRGLFIAKSIVTRHFWMIFRQRMPVRRCSAKREARRRFFLVGSWKALGGLTARLEGGGTV